MKDKIYLVTGAAGLLGSNITKTLISQGEKVRAFVLEGDPAVKHVPNEAEIVFGDVTDSQSLERLFCVAEGKEIIVIHCASIVTVTDGFNQKVLEVNVDGTHKIVQQCIKHKVKKLVYISSTSAIPELLGDQAIKEVESFTPDGIVGFYGQTKALASQIVVDAVKEHDLDASLVFPSGICGPNDFANGPVSSFIIDYVGGKMPVGLEGYFNAVDVRDLANGCIACAQTGGKGEGYIMGNQLVTMREMFDLLSEISGCKNVKTILPIAIGKLMGKISDLIGTITGKPGRMTSFAVYNMARNNNFSYQKAERELGYKVRPFKETIKDEMIWMKEESILLFTP